MHEGDGEKLRQTAILILYFFSWLCHSCVIFRALNLQAAAPLGACQLVSVTGDWPYLDPRLQIDDWPLQDSPPRICCRPFIYNFTIPMYSSCHPRDMLPLIYTGASCNHIFLHSWNIRLCQRSICNTEISD